MRPSPLAFVALVAAACVIATVTFPFDDPDLWQHLAVGRHLWTTHALPHQQLWTWPTYGAPEVLHSWLFRALLWPFWDQGGMLGLFAWRWAATLATFALLWAVARSMGARGVVPLVVCVLAALTWRQRSMARPETLAAVLFALQLWILEARRHAGFDRSWWLVAVLWTWVQAHISFPIGFVVLAAYAARDLARPLPGRRRAALVVVGLAAIAAAFVNPYGIGLVLQPFEYVLHQRGEALYRTIDELRPPDWIQQLVNGLPLLIAGWPLLALARAARRRADGVELMLCAFFTTLAVTSQRFLGLFVLAAVPFVSRDLAGWSRPAAEPRPRRGPPPLPPPMPGTSWRAAAIAAALCVTISIPELLRPAPRPGIGIDLRGFPVAAADFMEAHGIGGRGFNYFYHGGYLLWRSHAQRDQLPFMDVHQAGTPEIRDLYLRAFYTRPGWRALDERFALDYVVARRVQASGDSLLEFLDADPAFAPVFLDDDAALYVRRTGRLAAVADSFAFAHLPGGGVRLGPLGNAVEADSALRDAVHAELDRAAASSPRNARAHSLLANVAMIDARWEDAIAHLEHAIAVAPETPRTWERLRMIAEARGDAAAVRSYGERERRARGGKP